MGPAAWAAVGRALAVAVTGSLIFGRGGAIRLAVDEVVSAIQRHDLDVARAMVLDLRRNHREAYERFVRKYASDLPPEFLQEFGI